MAIRKRKTPKGCTAEYHYEFMQSGKRYYGVCEGCTTERTAREYEKRVKEQVKGLAEQKSARLLAENYRDLLTGGTTILIKDGYAESLKKPRKRIPSPRRNQLKIAHWNDFSCFMETTYPSIQKLSQVTRKHAEEYIAYLRTNGRFNTKTVYRRGKREITTCNNITLSSATQADYQTTLAEVFHLLHDEAGIIDNPFTRIPKPNRDSETREAFSEQDLKIIGEHLDDFTKPLFYIATTTALREGDICTLLWQEVNFRDKIILRERMNKTGKPVEIPILPPLMTYLNELKNACSRHLQDEYSKYVLPKHAKMYLTNASGVSYRVKQFLEDTCNIKTTRMPKGRSRAVSIKDLHSCRHTFCYYAGLNGIPLNIVQSIVGHVTPEMTKYYSAHATREAKREKMALMPTLLMNTAFSDVPPNDLARSELKSLIDGLSSSAITSLLNSAKKLQAQEGEINNA